MVGLRKESTERAAERGLIPGHIALQERAQGYGKSCRQRRIVGVHNNQSRLLIEWAKEIMTIVFRE